jgi:hypothetical protein
MAARADPKRASKEVRALARRAADVAAEASLDGLDAATAVMVAAIDVCFFDAGMTHREVADWFRRFANGLEAEERAGLNARVRAAMRNETKGA